MINVHVAVYICKAITQVGMPGYYDVALGLPGSDSGSSIIVRGTCSRFVIGREYFINIAEHTQN